MRFYRAVREVGVVGSHASSGPIASDDPANLTHFLFTERENLTKDLYHEFISSFL